MRYLVFFIFLFSLSESHALDLKKYVERLRSPMAKMFGDETTNKILGEGEKPEKEIELPEIPKVKVDAKDLSYYDKKGSKIYTQGSKYDALSTKEKRSFRVSFLQQLFEVTRNSEAKKEDIVKYLNVLEQGGNREGVYRSIVLDRVYLALESYDEAPTDALVGFIQAYALKFLAISYKAESIRQFNLYGLKRVITEKTLEVIETLAKKNPEHVYRWYAVFSKELARDHTNVWQTDVRKKEFDLYHYKWAQTVPFQHIKSEIIIKLHKVMNSVAQN